MCCGLCTSTPDPIGVGRTRRANSMCVRVPKGTHIGGESDLGSENREENCHRSPQRHSAQTKGPR